MKRLTFFIFFSLLLLPAISQRLAMVTIDNRGNADMISFLIDETVLLNITKDGYIKDWGIENTTIRNNIYPGRLDKYMGKEEFYPPSENEAYRGKVKYIGRTLISYYTASDGEALKGKVKTVGNSFFNYYTDYDDAAFKGNLKTAGSTNFTYYSSFDNQSYKGKIKAVGGVTLQYYGTIDDKAFQGKIKNIDRNTYTYYSSYDRREYQGMRKTGSQSVASGGIKFFIMNF